MNANPNTPEETYVRDLVKQMNDPRGSMHFLVYVREPESVKPVADWIRGEPTAPYHGKPELTPLVRGLVERDIVRLSSRHSLAELPERSQVDAQSLNPFQRGEALQADLYGVVHVPGLIKEQLKSGLQTNDTGFKNSHSIDHGHSY